jgi:hypothetical protein
MWADYWSLLTRLRVVVDDAETHEFIAIYHPHTRRPTWFIKPLDDGVAMCCASTEWAEEYVLPSLRAALLRIRRLTPAKRTRADWVVARSLPSICP